MWGQEDAQEANIAQEGMPRRLCKAKKASKTAFSRGGYNITLGQEGTPNKLT